MNRDLIESLRLSTHETADRGLLAASKWCAELLNAIPIHKRENPPEHEPCPPAQPFSYPSHHPTIPPSLRHTPVGHLEPTPSPLASTSYLPPYPALLSAEDWQTEFELQEIEQDYYDAALVHYQERSFLKAATVLGNKACRSNRAKFMTLYSQFLESEKQTMREWHRQDHTRTQTLAPINEHLPRFLEVLEDARDPYLLFLKALIITRLSRAPSSFSRRPEAIQCLFASIVQRPWNWSAWMLMAQCIDNIEELIALMPHLTGEFPPLGANETVRPLFPNGHPVLTIFCIWLRSDLSATIFPWDVQEVDRLMTGPWFPGSATLKTLSGTLAFHARDWDACRAYFTNIHLRDPFRIEGNEPSTEEPGEVAGLAMNLIENLDQERTRPEVCCILGIYHQIRLEWEKSLKMFRRAVELNPLSTGAWCAMGNTYLAIANGNAAIQCFRRCLDITANEFRAWSGLCRCYTQLNMWNYALYYGSRAIKLQPGDWRLWKDQALAYDHLSMFTEAARSIDYSLELFNTPNPLLKKPMLTPEAMDLIHIKSLKAGITKQLGDIDGSVQTHKEVVQHIDGMGQNSPAVCTFALSLLEIAEWEANRTDGDLVLALENCERVAGAGGAAIPPTPEEIGKAQEISRMIRSKQRGNRVR
ncbi:hypothetical protein DL96DRAFT_1592519 [Flagelloscypha sp. PMI_526]|nr:hypothetical protein DL96DRAFT_1592519 [Flagelloscypha sp. PMI_526]